MQLSIGTTVSMRDHGLKVESHAGYVAISGFRDLECLADSRARMQRQGYFVQKLDLIDCETGNSTVILAVKSH
jgi:hypothetical protein